MDKLIAPKAVPHRRGESPQDLLAWSRLYLPDHFAKPPSPMHRWLAEELDLLAENRGRKINLVGPRGHAKSTIATLAYVLRRAVEGAEPYIWIVSDTAHQAQTHLDNVRHELAENEKLAENYPDVVHPGRTWSAARIRLKTGTTIEAYGTGQRIRGKRFRAHRPSLIICDDLQNDGHIASAAQRDASRIWFHGTLLRAGNRRTNVVNLATALHRDALAMELARTPGWRSRIFAALPSLPTRTDLWDEWEKIFCDLENPDRAADARAFYDAHRDEMNDGAEVLWPEEEDLYALMQIRLESGRTAFNREKQSVPIDPERCEWPEEYFSESIWFDEWPEQSIIRTVALDPSKGGNDRYGDYSAYAFLVVDPKGIFYVDANLDRRATPRMVEDGVRLVPGFHPDVFGVEANQFQELLVDQFTAALARARMPTLPIDTICNNVPKAVRIRRLGPHLSLGRLRFLRGSTGARMLVDQLRDFPLGSHDDGPDALEMALRLANEIARRRSQPDDGLGKTLVRV